MCFIFPILKFDINLIREGWVLISPFLQNNSNDSEMVIIFGGMKVIKAHPGVRDVCENDGLIREFAGSQLNHLSIIRTIL